MAPNLSVEGASGIGPDPLLYMAAVSYSHSYSQAGDDRRRSWTSVDVHGHPDRSCNRAVGGEP